MNKQEFKDALVILFLCGISLAGVLGIFLVFLWLLSHIVFF